MDESTGRRFFGHLALPWLWPRHAKLWHRLAYSFGLLLVLMLVLVAVAVVQFRVLAQHSERMLQQDFKRMLLVQEVHQHAQGHGRAMARLLTSPRREREAVYPVADAEHAQIDRVLAQLKAQLTAAESQTMLASIVQRREHYREIFTEVASAIEADELAHASALFNGPGLSALSALLASTQELLEHELAALEARQALALAQITGAERSLALLALAAMALAALLAWRTTLSVAKPLARVESVALAISQGDYHSRVSVRGGDEMARVAQAINRMAQAIAARENEIHKLAFSDRLTGLPNRNGLVRWAANQRWQHLAVIHADVARLRSVNEVLGFEAGDELLTKLAARLTSVAEGMESDFSVARLEGGVFVCLCQDVSRTELEALRAQIDEVVGGTMHCAQQPIDVRLVYGLASAAGRSNVGLSDLLRESELGAAAAKRQQQPWSWYRPGDAAVRARQLGLLSDLERAAATGQLEMWLQPKLGLRTHRWMGMEALVRWQHPDWGVVPPADFIPFAEQTGHIGVITQFMLEQALAVLGRWAPRHPELTIAVNVSTLDLRDDKFVGRLETMARRHRAPLQRLKLEITESGLMESVERVMPVLLALRATGLQLSVDDFGTGYSSLAYLNQLPVNELKIDRSFVARADEKAESTTLLKAIVELGHSLGLTVVAEGVERESERLLLNTLDCDEIQGFLVARPQRLGEIEALLMAEAFVPS